MVAEFRSELQSIVPQNRKYEGRMLLDHVRGLTGEHVLETDFIIAYRYMIEKQTLFNAAAFLASGVLLLSIFIYAAGASALPDEGRWTAFAAYYLACLSAWYFLHRALRRMIARAVRNDLVVTLLALAEQRHAAPDRPPPAHTRDIKLS